MTDGGRREREPGYFRIVRIATQTKKITVPPRKITRASFSIPDTAIAYRRSGPKPPSTL
jgi:hypothetical protein